MTRALFIGRFQPLHKGHMHIIEKAMSDCSELVIVIGSSQEACTKDNPFSAEERVEMIKLALKGMENYSVVMVPDIKCDRGYVKHVITHTGEVDVVYAGDNQNTKKLFEEKGYRTFACRRFNDIRATSVREKMIKMENWEDYVLFSVSSYIKSIDGIARLREYSR